jgi:acyl-CoA synthetase (NDP forming)/RimJ/RimL family protein N-acetyltransferase
MTTVAAGRYALLFDGSTVEIRAARPDDADAVRQMHELMSPDNMYLRFFSLSPLAPDRETARLCRPADSAHAALLAWLDDRLVGVASYEPTARPGVAEIAFAVADEMHGRGIATLLLEHLVSLARQRHLTAFAAETLPENLAMQRVFAAAGLPVERRYADGVVELSMPLPVHDDVQLDRYLDVVARRGSRADVASLRHLLQPGSVAVIGAGRRRGSVGREILHNIVAGGFPGPVYAVNPRGRSMEGLACLSSADDLPAGVDLAVIAVPPAEVAAVAAQCGRRGVHSLVVITAGLGTGGADLLAICRRYGMRLVGPNCFGIAVPHSRLNATFGTGISLAGSAGLVVQSGGIGIAVLEHLQRLGIGLSSFASVGDKFDVSSNDMLCWWEQDEQTRLAVLYLESFGNPRGFALTARRVGRQLPVLTVIGGRSPSGQRAAASHTAAAATSLVTQEALFAQAGIIATRGLSELTDMAAYLSCQPLPAGDRIAIVSNAGGAGVLAADACADVGLTVATLDAATRRRLTRLLPRGAAVTGPVDTTATVTGATFRSALEIAGKDAGVDVVLAIVVPTAIADLRVAISAAEPGKPLAAVLLGQAAAADVLGTAAGADSARSAASADSARGAAVAPALRRIPVYAYPENAVHAIARAVRYREWRDSDDGHVAELAGIDIAGARTLVAAFLAACPEGGWLRPEEAARLLDSYQIPFAAGRFVTDADAAVAAAAELGGHVALKAVADGLVHKTDVGGVRLDLGSAGEVAAAYAGFAASFGDKLRTVQVQPMVPGGVEVMIGLAEDPVFGPIVVVGLGGVATEVLGDHRARLAPLTDADARQMIGDLRSAPLLAGFRGAAPVDRQALEQVLLRVSRLAEDLPEVAELDLNPVMALPGGVVAVDVRIRISPAEPRDPFLRQLR